MNSSQKIPIINMTPLEGVGGAYGDLHLGYLATDHRSVVVKYLRDSSNPDARKGFVREIRALERKYDGFVPILGYDVNAARPYYVMPHYPGGSLTKLAGRLSSQQLQYVAVRLATVIAGTHLWRDAHGDIKPDNLLISQDGQLSVGDPLGSGIHCTMLFAENRGGTPGYMAPEIMRGGAISPEADVYSYGATLYHLLTGRRPKNGDNLDPAAAGVTQAPKIREVILACCDMLPQNRPTMPEVSRILKGESWADIYAAKQQIQGLFKLACFLGGLTLLGTWLGRKMA